MIASLRYFLLGVREFRRAACTHPGDHVLAYERGREFAHRATFRRFEQG
jgi:hypothetical protein